MNKKHIIVEYGEEKKELLLIKSKQKMKNKIIFIPVTLTRWVAKIFGE